MEIDFDALIARTKLALSETKQETYLEPYRTQYSFEFLGTPVGKLEFLQFNHLFTDNNWEGTLNNETLVHGHKSNWSCYSPCFCHRWLYWPSELNSPRFRKQFNIKWEQIYKEKGWSHE